MARWAELICIATLAILLAILGTTPPTPEPNDHAADAFSSGRAMHHVRIIAAEPHPTGTQENAKVRAYLISQLEELGLEVSTTTGLVRDGPTAAR